MENNERHKDTGNRGYGEEQTKEEEKINDGMEVPPPRQRLRKQKIYWCPVVK